MPENKDMLHNQKVVKVTQVLCVTLDKYTNRWARIDEMTSFHDTSDSSVG